jgi:pimeloyl-ACP methyl ester carboxylesterase
MTGIIMLYSFIDARFSVKKHLLTRMVRVLVILTGFFLLAVFIVPLFITPRPLEELSAAQSVAGEQSRFMTVPFDGTNGITLHYLESGDDTDGGVAFVLLHGSFFNSSSWDMVIESLGELGRAVAYDQIPYGLSEKLTEGEWSGRNPYTTEAALEQLVSVLDVLGFDQVYLVGSSFGGTLAVRAALEYPSRVAGLILVAPAVFVDESMPVWLVESPQMNNLGPYLARLLGSGTSFYEKCYSDDSFFSGTRKRDTMIMTEVRDWDFALWQYLKTWGAGSVDFTGRIPEIDIPVLIVSGAEDRIVPPVDAEKLHAMLPRSTLAYIPDAGHMPQEESPEEFLDLVLPWIERVRLEAPSR